MTLPSDSKSERAHDQPPICRRKIFLKLKCKIRILVNKTKWRKPRAYNFPNTIQQLCFKRLPFGLKVSQDIFQLEMDRILEKSNGACNIVDDIQWGTNNIRLPNRWRHLSSGGLRVRKLSVVCLHNNAIVARCILDTNIALWATRTASAPSI